MSDADHTIAGLQERLADALDELAQRERHLEVLERFIAGLEEDYAQVEQSATEVKKLQTKVLDLEDQLSRAEATMDVLENFCFGLEQDHAQARQVAEQLEADRQEIFATIDQGLFTIAPDGTVNDGRSQATERMLGAQLSGRHLADVFGGDRRDAIERYVRLLFTRRAQDRMLRRISPLSSIWHAADGGEPRLLACRVTRIKDTDGGVIRALIEVNDRTERHRVEKELAERTKAHAAKIEKLYSILTLPEGVYADFDRDADATLEFVATRRPEDSLSAMRRVHTLKGSALALGLDRVAELCHELEDTLCGDQELDPAQRSERMHATIDRLRAELGEGTDLLSDARRITGGRMSSVTVAERLRASLRRVVEREAQASRKRVAMHFELDALELLPTAAVKALSHALVQGVRNAVAHGVESPQERVAAGKLPCGTIAVEIRADPPNLLASCHDDGRGPDVDALSARATQMGVPVSGEANFHELAFHSGLSTAPAVTAQAGRGVGMSVIQAAMAALGGRASLHGEPGRGTELRLQIPLSERAQHQHERGRCA